jgi:hypothetical protein
VLIESQSILAVFHRGSFLFPGRKAITTLGGSLREDMMWLNNLYEEAIYDYPETVKRAPVFSKAIRLVSCSNESADSIHFWQCFEDPTRMEKCGIFSKKKYSQDMLSQYVPEHYDCRTPLQLSAVNLAYALVCDVHDLRQNLKMMILLIIESGADLHEAYHCYTPLQLLLSTFPSGVAAGDVHGKLVDSSSRNLQRILREWLKILQRAGVDLNAYGVEESRQCHIDCSMEDSRNALEIWHDNNPWGVWHDDNPWFFSGVISRFTFSYGPTPDDWTVQPDMSEEYLVDFWSMVGLLGETELRALPGSWIDT